MTLLDTVLFLPLVGFFLLLLVPRNNPQASRMTALLVSVFVFAASLGLIAPYWFAAPTGWQFEHNAPWISYPPIRYHVAIDGLSLWLVLLSTLLTPIAVLVSWKHIDHRVKEFFAFLILLEFGLIGVFVSLDLFLFYVFWEVSLVPMYFLVGVWGHERRIYAAVKFFLYTMAGSVLMLAAIIYLYNKSGTFDYSAILSQLQTGRLAFDARTQLLLFLAFFGAFAIKVPLFPLHTWLPDAHVEAPTAGSLMLASVMLKMGTYGLVRYCLPLFPESAHDSAPWIAALAIIGIIYGALVALVQPNMKKLVAYSSVSHLGFVVLGIFSFTQQGLDGAVYQMLNHGISTGALFMLVGYMYERRHSLEIAAYGGVATPAPNLAVVFLITTLASIGLPMLNNFVGEYLVLQGTAQANFTWVVFAALGVILSACYMLWLYQRAFYGKASESLSHHMSDLTPREWAAIIPLLVLMVWMGTFTQTFLPPISSQNAQILQQSQPAARVALNAR
ncbi:MAG: NADH-quinone oxidoreductase subunit M [Bryobacterales bacterium]|nr:NADH-quinone oxidoreductase subunit M [Bryobacterales bacterium]MBV9397950.1 NADH-quinone oxidoreductase subunit M [Bryobacterales bacterium]